MVFATSHIDGMLIMNDIMGRVYREFYSEGRLFGVLPADMEPDFTVLEKEILHLVLKKGVVTRATIKQHLIPKFFIKYQQSDYNRVVKRLLEEKKLFSETGKKRTNDSTGLSTKPFK